MYRVFLNPRSEYLQLTNVDIKAQVEHMQDAIEQCVVCSLERGWCRLATTTQSRLRNCKLSLLQPQSLASEISAYSAALGGWYWQPWASPSVWVSRRFSCWGLYPHHTTNQSRPVNLHPQRPKRRP